MDNLEGLSYILDDPYLVGVFRVHDPAPKLKCGHLDPIGWEISEAYLWAIRQINARPDILPGVILGGVAIDSCGHGPRVTAKLNKIANMEYMTKNGTDLMDVDLLAGAITVAGAEEAQATVDTTTPLGITSILGSHAPARLVNPLTNMYTISTGPSPQVYAHSITSLLATLRWKYFSIVYLQDLGLVSNT